MSRFRLAEILGTAHVRVNIFAQPVEVVLHFPDIDAEGESGKKSGGLVEALKCLDQSLKADPGNTTAQADRRRVLEMMGK